MLLITISLYKESETCHSLALTKCRWLWFFSFRQRFSIIPPAISFRLSPRHTNAPKSNFPPFQLRENAEKTTNGATLIYVSLSGRAIAVFILFMSLLLFSIPATVITGVSLFVLWLSLQFSYFLGLHEGIRCFPEEPKHRRWKECEKKVIFPLIMCYDRQKQCSGKHSSLVLYPISFSTIKSFVNSFSQSPLLLRIEQNYFFS